jgi:beta-alanine--pyruvate transaminase
MDAFWMPFTANRQFKAAPRLLASASGMYYRDRRRPRILDATAGLWCCNAGHSRPRIVEAVKPADRHAGFRAHLPDGFIRCRSCWPNAWRDRTRPLNHVFFTNSGSESVDTALKIAIAYHRVRGEGQRTRLIGREKGYHGVGFGGISVGGLPNNRKFFGPLLPAWTTCATRWTSNAMPSAKGCRARRGAGRRPGAHGRAARRQHHRRGHHRADLRLAPAWCCRRGLPAALREICDKHGILLIFDEVITGFGRVGNAFAAQRFGVTAGHDHHRQGPDQRLRADGRGVPPTPDPRRLHARARTTPSNCSMATPIPATRWPAPPPRHAGHLRRGKPVRQGASNWATTGRTACTR